MLGKNKYFYVKIAKFNELVKRKNTVGIFKSSLTIDRANCEDYL
jgi:hypothetical protein